MTNNRKFSDCNPKPLMIMSLTPGSIAATWLRDFLQNLTT